jgi:hypothetical protein
MLGSSLSFAQSSTGTITGKLLDPARQPVAYATVVLQTPAADKVAKAGYSDDLGTFELPGVEPGEYQLNVTFIGYETFLSEKFVLQPGQIFVMADIMLREAAKELTEVVVVAQRPLVEVRADMTVFNVDGTANATGHSAMELLRKAPKVLVDNNDNVSIQGKSGVRVYIDGKPSPLRGGDLAAFLQNMQSTQVDAIEIITNPSARFDAEGNAGIINIRLKKDKNLGTNATTNLGYAVGRLPKYNATSNFNFRNRAMNVFGSYGINRNFGTNGFNLNRTQFGTNYDQRNLLQTSRWNHSYRFGSDFFLSKKHTVGFLVNGYINDGQAATVSRTAITELAVGAVNSVLVANNAQTTHRDNLNFNLNYRFDNGKARTLNVDADYGHFASDIHSDQPNYYFDPTEQTVLTERIYAMDAPTGIQIATFKADYEQPLWSGKLGAGVKSSFVITDNTFDFFNVFNNTPQLDLDRSNHFDYTENVNAAYFNFQNKLSDRWSYQLGLRVENTNSLGELLSAQANADSRVERSYTDVFPSGGLTYQLNKKNSFSLTYSRRIDRPSYQDLNPFQMKLDELSYRQGNAFLRPQYTNSLEFGHNYGQRLNSSIGYSVTNDMFAEITDTSGLNSSFIKTENLAEQKVLTFNVSYPFSAAKWWNVFATLSTFYSQTHADFGEGKTIDLDVASLNFYNQHSFILPKGLTFEVSGFYNSPSVWGGVHRTREMWGMDIGLQKKLLSGKATLKLTYSDVFNTMQWRSTNQFGELNIVGSGWWESQQFRANFTYLLGNQSVKSTRRRQTGLEDENKRIKSS